MNIKTVVDALKLFDERNLSSLRTYESGHVYLLLSNEEYAQAKAVRDMVSLAELTNYMNAQAAVPKLLMAVKLILAIADNPFSSPADRVFLAPKTRGQLEDAVESAQKTFSDQARKYCDNCGIALDVRGGVWSL